MVFHGLGLLTISIAAIGIWKGRKLAFQVTSVELPRFDGFARMDVRARKSPHRVRESAVPYHVCVCVCVCVV